MNIDDIRFLFSALIQALPTIISLSLIGVFALKPEREIVKKYRKALIIIVVIFYIAILMNIITLVFLTTIIESYSYLLAISSGFSVIAIICLTGILIQFIIDLKEEAQINEKKESDILKKFIHILRDEIKNTTEEEKH